MNTQANHTEGYHLLNSNNQVIGWTLHYIEPQNGEKLIAVGQPLPQPTPEPIEDTPQSLTELKNALILKIAEVAQHFATQLAGLDKVPAFEIETWVIQGREAKAWYLDHNSPTPVLDIIATARGIERNLLRQKAYEKTMQFEMMTATIAGQRQKWESLILQAPDHQALKALNIAFHFMGQEAKVS